MTNDTTIEQVAEWFLARSPMTHKKLQKLCYYSVAWGWALMDRGIANNGNFEAWVHGPVSPILYTQYRKHGWNDIPQVQEAPKLPDDINEMLEAVWVTYGSKSGNELEALSHKERPWVAARAGLSKDDICKNVIDTKIMKDFYNSIKTTDF